MRQKTDDKVDNNAVIRHSFYRKYGKRMLDIFFSGLVIILLSPILLILCVLVRIIHGAPILYSPARPGLNEQIFHVYKFRSMKNTTDSEGKMLPEKDRITPFGRFLRATSLDEIPELFNIFKGDMSIVGPRPLIRSYLTSYTSEQRIRHSVRPGLTGLAQISGRNNLPWDQRMEKDIEYVRNLSFGLDCSIVFRTILKVLKRENISLPGGNKLDLSATNLVMEEGKVRHLKAETTWPEIGSHFWIEESKSVKKQDYCFRIKEQDHCFTFSGRAAIALAIRDAIKEKSIKKALIPSYCCLSMLQTFQDLNIPYEFFDVEYIDGEVRFLINENEHCDLLLIMRYFNAITPNYDEIIHKMKQQGSIVIEDITHSLFNDKPGNDEADYHVASIRKWLPIPAGGYLSKTYGAIAEKPYIESNHAVEKKILAMTEKRDYIIGKHEGKESFLVKFNGFEQELVQLSPFLLIDDFSKETLEKYDIESMKSRRRENAAVLYERLSRVKDIAFLNQDYNSVSQVPLFVPIMMPEESRDDLRKYLIDEGVYCPVHWPEVMGAKPGIRKNELSLICDQRYERKDMEAIANLIITWCMHHSMSIERNGES